MIQKYNFITIKSIKEKSVETKKSIVSRTDADEAVDLKHKKGKIAGKICADRKCLLQ